MLLVKKTYDCGPFEVIAEPALLRKVTPVYVLFNNPVPEGLNAVVASPANELNFESETDVVTLTLKFASNAAPGNSEAASSEGGEAAGCDERQGNPHETIRGPAHGAGKGAGQQPESGTEAAERPEPAYAVSEPRADPAGRAPAGHEHGETENGIEAEKRPTTERAATGEQTAPRRSGISVDPPGGGVSTGDARCVTAAQ